MPQSQIRLGSEGDLAAIRTFDEFSNRRAAEIAEGRLYAFEQEGDVVGYISIASSPLLGHPYVEFLCVAPAARRAGVASALLAHAESIHPGRRLVISTEEWNQPMLALLAGRGYLLSGSLAGLNSGGAAEVYYYLDIPQS